jgi:hypothetical protein
MFYACYWNGIFAQRLRLVTIIKNGLTSADVVKGVADALAYLAAQNIDFAAIEAVMIGTTQFTNAVVQRRELAPVAAIRLGLPSGRGMPPMLGWPEDMAAAMGGHIYMLHGGYLYDGRLLAPMDEAEIEAVIVDLEAKGIKTAAITSAFAFSGCTSRAKARSSGGAAGSLAAGSSSTQCTRSRTNSATALRLPKLRRRLGQITTTRQCSISISCSTRRALWA